MISVKKSLWLGAAILVFFSSVYLVYLLKSSDGLVESPLDQKVHRLSLENRGSGDASSAGTKPSFQPSAERKTIRQYFGSNPGVFVHFWAAWCAPCLKELPEVTKFLNSEGAKKLGVKVLAISLDPTEESARETWNRAVGNGSLPESLILLWDPKMETAHGLGSYQFPETYLFNPHGRLLHKWIGPQSWVNIAFENQVRELIAAGASIQGN